MGHRILDLPSCQSDLKNELLAFDIIDGIVDVHTNTYRYMYLHLTS